MYSDFLHFYSVFFRKFRILILALCIIAGLLSGICVVLHCGFDVFQLMGGAVGSVSIVGLLIVVALPFLSSLFLIYSSKRCFLFLLCFIRCFLFGYCMQGIAVCYGSGAWLFSFLYMFTSLALFPLDIWLWSHYTDRAESPKRRDFVIYFCIACVAVFLDYRIVSPFLTAVIDI